MLLKKIIPENEGISKESCLEEMAFESGLLQSPRFTDTPQQVPFPGGAGQQRWPSPICASLGFTFVYRVSADLTLMLRKWEGNGWSQ